MIKKLWRVFGPLFCAAILLLIFLLTPWKIDLTSPKVLDDAASSMSPNVLKGETIKNTALAEKKYVAFFGSSELSRINPFHPSALAEKYKRGYEPFLLGAPGTQSLSQYLMVTSTQGSLEKKKAVMILSPQWFIPEGTRHAYFDFNFSPLQAYQWLEDIKNKQPSAEDVYLAKRLLEYDRIANDSILSKILEEVKAGQPLSNSSKFYVEWNWRIYRKEDQLFSKIGLQGREEQIDQAAAQLPDVYKYKTLDNLAYEIGKSKTNNNPFEINNSFYQKRVKKIEPKLRGSQLTYDYRCSKEYSDFQLVLNQFAEDHTDVLFILPPVNGKWSSYTGLSQEMLKETNEKIIYQLKSQGFNNIDDLSGFYSTDYFMMDTIHLGWRGWLQADRAIKPFIEQKQAAPNYQIDSYYLTKEWQQFDPKKLPEK